MKFRFLGVGGAFEPQFGNSAALLDTGKDTLLLLDCGGTTFCRLKELDLAAKVTHILVTHLHDDHVGSLGSLMFYRYYVQSCPMELLCPPQLEAPLRNLLRQQYTAGPLEERVVIRRLEGEPSDPSRLVGTARIDFIDTTGQHQPDMPTCAYLIELPGELIAYSGDLGNPDLLFRELEARQLNPTVVFHDVIFQEMHDGPHAWYKDVEQYIDRYNIRGYHNNPTEKPRDCRLKLAWEDGRYTPERPWDAS